jgi:Alpha-acetolactate decarboxylase
MSALVTSTPAVTVLEGQVEFPLEQVTATLVGFRLPDYMAESNAAGYHFHAVTEDRDAVAMSWTAKRPTSPSSLTPSTPGRSSCVPVKPESGAAGESHNWVAWVGWTVSTAPVSLVGSGRCCCCWVSG